MKRRSKAGKSRSSGFSLHVMTDDEVHEIHLGTLEALKDVGVFVESEEALENVETYERAMCSHDKMIDILETYEPPKLSDDVLKNVRSIVKEAENKLGVDGGDD